MKKVLVANRGEIAIRVIRAARELGLKTVAVYSEGDKDSMHVRLADESVCIGPPEPADSYLNIYNIMSAAEITGADAIHPGYGFLAENPRFRKICEEHNVLFIGPSAESIKLMGDKSTARRLMKEAGVPILPGTDVIKDLKEALKAASEIGYPVMIKASAGGGGRGMRIANSPEELEKLIPVAQSEAKAAFGDPSVYIEKYIPAPKHVEIQILADAYGNAVYLGERECSVQRRHQKLLEEAPSPIVDNELRAKMGEAAIKAVKAVKYYGAGTVEFLVDPDKNFYFMEMNTRIQVEHPITEMVTRIDIVKEMFKIAMGEKLSFTQEDIKLKGHAIEARINAEDPENNFSPNPAKIDFLYIPGGPGIRVDTHVYQGYTIPPFYDSLIAKLIAYGHNREEAITRLKRALKEFIIEGPKTTIPFHLEVLEHEKFVNGTYTTKLLTEMGYEHT